MLRWLATKRRSDTDLRLIYRAVEAPEIRQLRKVRRAETRKTMISHAAVGVAVGLAMTAGLVVTGGVGGGAVFSSRSTGGSGFTCNSTISSPGGTTSVSTALSSLTAGQTLCLNDGSYTYTGGTISKASMTTVRAAGGPTSRDNVIITSGLGLGTSSNLTFQDITVAGMDMGSLSATNPSNLQLNNLHYTGCTGFLQGGSGTWNVTIDGGVADMSSEAGTGAVNSICGTEGAWDFRGNDGDPGDYGTSLIGLTIKNIVFGRNNDGMKCSDGLQLRGGFTGATIGPGNTFQYIQQNVPTVCAPGDPPNGPHADPIQPYYGGYYFLVTGNYYHHVETGAWFSTNGCDHVTFTNNVVDHSVPATYFANSMFNWCTGSTVTHNVFVGDEIHADDFTDSADHPAAHTSGIFNNNVFVNGASITLTGTGNVATQNYNLRSTSLGSTGGGGPNNVIGTPVFVGGSSPTTWAGWALATGSPGKGAASDGLDIGINP